MRVLHQEQYQVCMAVQPGGVMDTPTCSASRRLTGCDPHKSLVLYPSSLRGQAYGVRPSVRRSLARSTQRIPIRAGARMCSQHSDGLVS
jgi:hypothetical protein